VLSELDHGWPGLLFAYLLAALGLFAGLSLRRKPIAGVLGRLPLTSLVVVIVGLLLWTILREAAASVFMAFPRAVTQLLGVGFTFVIGILTGVIAPRLTPELAVRRGARLTDGPSQRSGAAGGGADASAVTVAGQPICLADETKHFKLIGTTGTGKSTAIRELLQGALERGDRAVIADPDGGYLKTFYDAARGDVVLNPFHPLAARWDLFGEIVELHDADQLARSLIADHDDPDRNWRQYGRTFLTAILRQLHSLGEHDVGKLYYLLLSAPVPELRELLRSTPAEPFLGQENLKFFESVRSIASVQLAAIEHIALQKTGEPTSTRNWIRSGKGVLFLPYRSSEIAVLRYLISTWMRLAIFEAMSGEEVDQRLWFIVDELDALGAIDGLKDALARMRKFGGRCVLGLQSIAQVRGTYGDAEAQTIVENCGNTLILRCSASERGGTAEFASRLIGEREVIREQVSYSRPLGFGGAARASRTRSEQHAIEPAVMASEIEQLPDLTGFLKVASRPEWQRVTIAHAR
jgi:type IV secretory pathway TraG/TraD family ATPase VirD4